MLGKCRVLSQSDVRMILSAIDGVHKELKASDLSYDVGEDLYFNIEYHMTQKIGSTAGKMHTGRSRNDLSAALSRMVARRELWSVMESIIQLQSVLVEVAIVNNAWAGILKPLFQTAPLSVRAVCVILAPVMVGLGIALEQYSNTGMVPNDLFPLLIFERQRRFQYRTVRIIFDFSELFLSIVLGATLSNGDIGLGTITAALLIGPSLQFWLKVISSKGK